MFILLPVACGWNFFFLDVRTCSCSDFLQKMENLSKRMGKIATLSKDLSAAFSKHRENVSQLSDANKKVKGLQFLLCLPQKLQVSDLKIFLEFFSKLFNFNKFISNVNDMLSFFVY